MKQSDLLEQRIVDIEMRITRQDDLVEQLNAVIYDQQKIIDQLIKRVNAIEKSDDPTAPRNEKPPHY